MKMSYKFLIISKLFLILILAHCIACHDKDKGKGHGGKGKGNEGDNGKGKAKKKRLIEGIDADYYAPTDTEGYTPQAMRKIMRYCTKKPNDPKCKDEWVITASDQFTPDNPLDADNYDNFPEVKKYVGKKVPKYKIIDPLKGIPHKFKKKLPPGFSKKLRKKDIDAIKKNCPDDTCKQDKEYNRNLRATLAEYDVAINQLAYPDKPLDEIDEEVETKMTKPADNGLFDDDCLLTLEQADALINQLNSSLEYSFAIPESQFNSRRKRAGDLLYFNTNPTKQWPIGQPIPYGFDKSLSNSQRENIRTCIRDITSKTCLTFTELDLGGSPPNISSIYFIRYITTAYCGISYVGVNYPYNPIYLTFLCPDMVGVTCHEIMHALGVQHEHVRPDRDNSITVLWDNIDPQSIDSFIPSDAATFSRLEIINLTIK